MKWKLIKNISEKLSKYGDLLLGMIDKYNKNSLQELTEQEVKEF